jgi:hypothetical protein
MGTVGRRRATGWVAVCAAVFFPITSWTKLPHYPWFGSYDLPYLLFQMIGLVASVVAARLLDKRWYWLTGFWAVLFVWSPQL